MSLKSLLKKKDKIKEDPHVDAGPAFVAPTIIRSDTLTEEPIEAPNYPGDDAKLEHGNSRTESKRFSKLRRASDTTTRSRASSQTSQASQNEKRHSYRLHLRSHSRTTSTNSVNVPKDLPSISDDGDENETEAAWERRATILAQGNPNNVPETSQDLPLTAAMVELDLRGKSTIGRPSMGRSLSDAQGDENIQEAIRLHEAGELEKSTAMFGRLAGPSGTGNSLAGILYGLALRHGWGCSPDPTLAVKFLSHAAANAAAIESQALSSGIKKGGALKGELVLALFELGQSFLNGWGTEKDPVAARSYFETAGNLGDVEALEMAARCYLEGIGGKKDKFVAATLLRSAEAHGSRPVGNSWIWKEKYNPKNPDEARKTK